MKIKVRGGRFALQGSLELTFRCNLRCRHCYVNRPVSEAAAKKEELTFKELRRILDEAVDCGLLNLLLTGGEPFLRPDFKTIYRYCQKRGIAVVLGTNGTLITDELANFLAQHPPHHVEFSLYGATQETYETVTRIPGSYKRSLRGLQRLVERKIPVQVKATLLTLNYHERRAMEALAKKLGCPFRLGVYLHPRLDGSRDPLRFRISPEEACAADMSRSERIREIRERLTDCFQQGSPNRHYACTAGTGSFHIDPSGKMSVCSCSRKWQYDLRAGHFEEAWYRAMPDSVLFEKRNASSCSDCSFRALCGNCPGVSELETGKTDGVVPYLCELTHRWVKAMGLPADKAIVDTVSSLKLKGAADENEKENA
ncbi:MAG: radical SAM protein [Candidatus Omnitrophota bacterium]